MTEDYAFYTIVLYRFFERFMGVTYHDVSICRYVYYHFLQYVISRWRLTWKNDFPDLFDEVRQFKESDVYHYLDQPYIYESHPDGVIVLRGAFGDFASFHLPKEHFFLISPNQAELDILKTLQPNLSVHNFENYYRDNPKAAVGITKEVAQVIAAHKDDPIFGRADLFEWFQSKIPEIIRILDAAHSLFEGLKIGAVVTASSISSMDGALNLIARANRIPSFTLQHGVYAERDLFCHIPIVATKKAVWGSEIRHWYQKFGYPESRIAVTGSPHFDLIFKKAWYGKEKLCEMLGIHSSQKVIVYATQPLGTEIQTIVPIVREGLKQIPNLFTMILLHSGEEPSIYQQFCQGFSNCAIVRFGHISLYDALSGADFFITWNSTAAVEAMLFKLPVITVEPYSSYFSFGDQGASIRVSSSSELNQTVTRLISDETYKENAVAKYQNFLSRYCIPDGLASQRLFDQVEQLCNTGGTI